MKLGAHLSISGGISNALIDAHKIGANTLQIFSSSPRGWQDPDIKKKEILKFNNLSKKYKIYPIFIHSKYLVNLSSDNKKIVNSSIKSLINDLKLSTKIKASGVIFHPKLKNFNLLISSIKKVLSQTPKSSFLILENSSQMKLEEIGKIIKACKNKRIKFCFDAAHAFQSGYDLTSKKGISKTLNIIKKEIGINRLVVIHTNDSKTDSGSKHDRHEDIGKGKLGLFPFSFLLNHKLFKNLPFILETPGFREQGLAGDRKNLQTLKKLVITKNNK